MAKIRIIRLVDGPSINLDFRIISFADGSEAKLAPQWAKALTILARHQGTFVPASVFHEHGILAIGTIIKRLRELVEPDRAKPRYLITALRITEFCSGYALANYRLEILELPSVDDDLDGLLYD
jgi:hypothetical protein